MPQHAHRRRSHPTFDDGRRRRHRRDAEPEPQPQPQPHPRWQHRRPLRSLDFEFEERDLSQSGPAASMLLRAAAQSTALTSLAIRGTLVSAADVELLSAVPRLQQLKLEVYTVPPVAFPALQSLSLSRSFGLSELPATSTCLRDLNLRDCNLRALPAHLTTLTRLNLCSNRRLVPDPAPLPSLTALSLRRCNLARVPDGALASYPALTELEVSGNRGFPLAALAQCPQIQKLYMGTCRIQGAIPAGVLPQQLRVLKLSRNSRLTRCPPLRLLEELNMAHCAVMAFAFGDFPRLVRVDLSGNRELGPRLLRKRLPRRLEVLQLADCGIDRLPSNWLPPRLLELDLSCNRGLRRIDGRLGALTRLTTLLASECALDSLQEGDLPPSLTSLDLSGNQITSRAVCNVVLGLRRLRELSVV